MEVHAGCYTRWHTVPVSMPSPNVVPGLKSVSIVFIRKSLADANLGIRSDRRDFLETLPNAGTTIEKVIIARAVLYYGTRIVEKIAILPFITVFLQFPFL